jgi:thiol-disulfide isomerase/thioredoxin
MEALMSRITADGPAPKRPPHNALDPDVRVVIATFLLAVSLAGCSRSADATADKAKTEASQAIAAIDRSHAGTPAPTVKFEERGGSTHTLADFGGRPVLVNLWATWCAPCVAELPDLEILDSSRGDALTVLAISQDMEGWNAVGQRFSNGKFVALVPYLDQPGNFAQAMGAKGLPMSILYDGQGKEVWRTTRPLKWNSPEVRALLP